MGSYFLTNMKQNSTKIKHYIKFYPQGIPVRLIEFSNFLKKGDPALKDRQRR